MSCHGSSFHLNEQLARLVLFCLFEFFQHDDFFPLNCCRSGDEFKDFSFPHLKCKYEMFLRLSLFVCSSRCGKNVAQTIYHDNMILYTQCASTSEKGRFFPWNESEPSFLVLPVRVLKSHVFSPQRDWKRGTFGRLKGEFKIKTWHKVEITNSLSLFFKSAGWEIRRQERVLTKKQKGPTDKLEPWINALWITLTTNHL